MRTTVVKDENGKEWYVFHRGDWSGNAQVRPKDSTYDEERESWSGEVTLPGFVIKNACRQSLADDLRNHFESSLEEFFDDEV